MSDLILSPQTSPATVVLVGASGAAELDLAAGQRPATVLGAPGTAQGVFTAGVIGIPGPAGIAGTSARLSFHQATASLVWLINHNFGYYPEVKILALVDGVTQDVQVSVQHDDVNNVRVLPDFLLAGYALLI
jgi:hypothetical protein